MSLQPSPSSQASTVSLSSGGPIPAPTGCNGNSTPTLRNTTGMSGRVCQTNTWLVSIDSCCGGNSEVRIQDNCTQYCETENDRFLQCVLDLFESPPLYQFALCQVAGNSASAFVTTSSSTTNVATPSAGTTGVVVSITVSGNEDEPDAAGSAAPDTEGSETSSNTSFQQLKLQ